MPQQVLGNQERDAILVGSKLSYVAVPAFVGLFAYAFWHRDKFLPIMGMGVLVSLASLVAGLLVGFLFGIPKSPESARTQVKSGQSQDQAAEGRQGHSAQAGLRRNTNIEEISDWLTKIIVGLGIYELKKVPEFFRRLAAFLGPGFGDGPGSGALAVMLIVAFASSGFMLGYLLTVLFITRAIARVDLTGTRDEEKLLEDVNAAKLVQAVTTGTGEGGASEALKQQVLSLCDRYERKRDEMLPGPERTNVMEAVTREMRKLALAAYSMLPELSKSPSPGQRLAAAAFLQVRPSADPAYIDWLSAEIASEKPFIKYQAALALRSAVRALPAAEHEKLRKAIADGKKALRTANRANSDEYAVLERAEQELG